MNTCTLTGSALRAEASRLAIPGRSRMTASDLRTAIDSLSPAPAPAQRIPAPAPGPLVPFVSANGKRKRSAPRIYRRSI